MPVHVRTAVCGIFAAASLGAAIVTAQASSEPKDDALVGNFFPYRAFEKLPSTRIDLGGGTLTVAFGPGELELSHETVLAWVTRSARAVAGHFGRLPDPNSRLLIVPTPTLRFY